MKLRVSVVLVLSASLLAAAVACGGGGESAPKPTAITEFIDSEPIRGSREGFIYIPGGLPGVVGRAHAVVVAEVLEIADVTVPVEPAPSGWPVTQLERDPLTTYSVRVEQWVKGQGEDEILVTGFGGITAPGPVFNDGDFLLEPGRRYILALNTKRAGLPGPGIYERVGMGLGNFEVTDGVVHVLNNPLTQGLQEKYGGMPLADFVGVLQGFLAATPTPSAAPLSSATP